MKLFHFLQADMTSPNAPRTVWKVGQTRKLPGKEIVPCEYGYHASPTLWDALKYAPGPMACLVELDDATLVPHGNPVDKYAARSRTLIAAVNIERELRLFGADCAEQVLWIYERDYPNDSRPRNAIQAARDLAEGRIGDAAGFAAWAAAGAAARDAAGAAARDAAWFAARDAAGAAAWAAAGAAAGAAARDAARDAARAAAEAAAEAAAWTAAGAAAGAVARAAAWAAEQAWQRQQFDQRFAGLFSEVTS